MLFDLPGYRVLDAQDDLMGRWALVEPVDPVGHCPDCGFDSARVHSRPVSRVEQPDAQHVGDWNVDPVAHSEAMPAFLDDAGL